MTDSSYTTQCCICKKTVDMREPENGGDEHGAELYGGIWVCSGDCWDKAQEALPKMTDAEIAADGQTQHREALRAYLRSGGEVGMCAPEGSYLVDQLTAARIEAGGRGAVRSVANVVQIETGGITEGAAPSPPEKVSIPMHELSAHLRVSQWLLDDIAFDIEGWLADRIAEKFARAENAAFVTGDGVDKPTGFLSYPKVAANAWAWGSLGYVATGAAGAFNPTDPADALVDLVYSLDARYRGNAVFVMNSKTAGAVRKIKDADGKFLWSESLSAEQAPLLLGHPVLSVEDMPDIAPDAFAIAFGDLHAGYTIAEWPDVRIMRDPYSTTPHVQFFATSRVGGDVTDFGAIRLLKFAAPIIMGR